MNMTFHQKAELDALVNFFGGRSMLMMHWQCAPTHKALHSKGLIRWGKKRGGMVENIATKKGIMIAKRFKRDWSQLWAEAHPDYEVGE